MRRTRSPNAKRGGRPKRTATADDSGAPRPASPAVPKIPLSCAECVKCTALVCSFDAKKTKVVQNMIAWFDERLAAQIAGRVAWPISEDYTLEDHICGHLLEAQHYDVVIRYATARLAHTSPACNEIWMNGGFVPKCSFYARRAILPDALLLTIPDGVCRQSLISHLWNDLWEAPTSLPIEYSLKNYRSVDRLYGAALRFDEYTTFDVLEALHVHADEARDGGTTTTANFRYTLLTLGLGRMALPPASDYLTDLPLYVPFLLLVSEARRRVTDPAIIDDTYIATLPADLRAQHLSRFVFGVCLSDDAPLLAYRPPRGDALFAVRQLANMADAAFGSGTWYDTIAAEIYNDGNWLGGDALDWFNDTSQLVPIEADTTERMWRDVKGAACPIEPPA